MILAKALTKTYGKPPLTAVDAVDLTVNSGELFGLIGPDGAGKTSLIRMLTTLLLPDAGQAEVMGLDVVRDYKTVRRKIGYMPGRFSLYPDLTVEENLSFFATVFDTSIQANYALIEDLYVQIEPFKNRRAGKLSGGMKQKLALCCALIHEPEVLFLDEPTTGVDPVSRKEFWQMLGRLKSKGITILVSTPYMDEASLCDRIALMQNGRILEIDSPEAIRATYPGRLLAVRASEMFPLLQVLRTLPELESSFAFGEHVHVKPASTGFEEDKLLKQLHGAGLRNIEMKWITPEIEDCFIDLMQNEKQRDRH